jgi:hypothetical protein
MARYAITRERNLRGLGRTFSFVPRRRTLRGLGQTSDIDIVTGLPCDDPRANCGPFEQTTTIPAPTTLGPPPGFFTSPAPIIPAPVTVPVIPPTLVTPIPGGALQLPNIVFPSSGGTARPLAPPTGWLDQQLIPGLSNTTLVLATIGTVLLFSMTGARRRR